MGVMIAIEELNLLIELVEARITGLRPEIRRSREHTYRSALKQEQQMLVGLLEHLKSIRRESLYPEHGPTPQSIQP